MTKKQTKNTVTVSFAINFLEKLPESIVKFLMSIIGPNTRNPKMDMKGNWFAKLRATIASDEEQSDSRKAIPIKSNMERITRRISSLSHTIHISQIECQMYYSIIKITKQSFKYRVTF